MQVIKYIFSSCLLLIIANHVNGQYDWNWTELEPLPFRTSNNAVCEAVVGGDEYVYSFGGIDTSKHYSGIHQRSFKYTVATDVWEEIQPLPDTLGKIAAGASFVKGKIYIIGGYHVFQDGGEISSDRVHIYNPSTDQYEADGAAIPLAIDDHVQCVYKDSLIYVVTGWSNTTNYPDVQIYDPANDQWSAGTSVPNMGTFKAFGASGYILGDTLYYHGGVTSGFSFNAQSFMRKGYINPNDPTDITWELMEDAPGDKGYRAACSGNGTTVFWVGGAGTAYNYDGIAYNGSGGVQPSARILHFNAFDYEHIDNVNEPIGMMDFRGIAKLSNNRWIIAGGMDTNQVVSNRTFLLENDQLSIQNISNENSGPQIYSGETTVTVKWQDQQMNCQLIDVSGKIIKRYKGNSTIVFNTSEYQKGMYFLVINNQFIERIRM